MTSKVFVNSENKATFTCPNCAKAKTADVSEFLKADFGIKLKAKCPCGHSYSVVLERRKYYRKKTSLPGVFRSKKNPNDMLMTVTNLSRSGLQFVTPENRGLEKDDQVEVEFRLDDRAKSIIKKKAVVRKITGNAVGAEFCIHDQYDKVLGFYLFN